MEEVKHVYGPVPSRRLGRSLGVDLVPFKTCTYDCIYCGGITGLDAEVAKIKRVAAEIQPDRVQLNTAVRPTAEDFAFALSPEALNRLAGLLGPEVEVISEFRSAEDTEQSQAKREDVLGLLARRPCTLSDVASALKLHLNEATKYLTELEREGLVLLRRHRDSVYYRARRGTSKTEPREERD